MTDRPLTPEEEQAIRGDAADPRCIGLSPGMVRRLLATLDEARTAPVDALGVVLDRLETALPEGWDLMFGTDRKHGGQGGWWATASQPTQEHGGYRIVSTTADHRKTDPTLIEAVENLLERLAREPSL